MIIWSIWQEGSHKIHDYIKYVFTSTIVNSENFLKIQCFEVLANANIKLLTLARHLRKYFILS